MPIGVDDFKKLIDKGYYFVDKSLYIKDLLDMQSEVTLITRPRRFGKTLNMSMLKYFFEKTEEDNSYLENFLDLQRMKFLLYVKIMRFLINIKMKKMVWRIQF